MHLPGESTPLAAKRFAGLRSRRTFPSPSPSSHAGVSGLVPECSLPLDNQDSLASALLGLRLLLLRGFIGIDRSSSASPPTKVAGNHEIGWVRRSRAGGCDSKAAPVTTCCQLCSKGQPS